MLERRQFIEDYVAKRRESYYKERRAKAGLDASRKVLIGCAAVPGSNKNIHHPELHDVIFVIGHRHGTKWEYRNELRLNYHDAVDLRERLRFAILGDPDELYRYEARQCNRVFEAYFQTLEQEAEMEWEERVRLTPHLADDDSGE